MNRTHRVIWSQALGAFVVTHEHAKAGGKPCMTRKALRGAIALALGSLVSEMAVAACSPGIAVSGDGSSHIVNAGHICNVPIGVMVTQATVASGLTNSGSIQAGSAVTIAGSTLGNILNTGSIHGQFGALTVNSSSLTGSFKNKGTITVSTSAAGAVYFASGTHLAAGVVNNGVIESSEGAAIHLRDSSIGANGIANVGGTLNAFTGISLTSSSVAGGIRNSGVIAGTSRGISLLNADVSGDIKNSGSIAGSSAIAIIDSRVNGSLINFAHGLITGISPSHNAIEVDNSSISGTLLNNGSIVSHGNALVLKGSTLAGGLNNHGDISGDRGGLLVSNSLVTGGILNAGLVSLSNADPQPNNGRHANIGSAIAIDHSSVSGGITNTGTLAGGTFAGRALNVQNSLVTGDISNAGRMSAADYGLLVLSSTVKGNVANSGNIDAQFGSGMAITASTIHGDVTSSHTLSGGQYGLAVTSSKVDGDVVNAGSVTAGSDGIRVAVSTIGGSVINSGSVQAGSVGYLVTGKVGGSVVNSGAVNGRVAMLVGGTIGGDVVNTGSLTGKSSALAVYGSSISGAVRNNGNLLIVDPTVQTVGPQAALLVANSRVKKGLTNSGSIGAPGIKGIQVSGSSITGGVSNVGASVSGKTALAISASHVEGGLRNSGQLQGSYQGLVLDRSTVNGGIVNDGSIIGASGYGVDLTNHAYVFGGGLINHGLISGGLDAVRIYSTTLDGGFLNTGNMLGQHAVDIHNATVIGTISNTGNISGSNQGMTIDDSLVYGNLINHGELNGVGTGLSFIHSTLAGRLVNLNDLVSDFTALNIDGSTIRGGITNSGTIYAGSNVLIKNSQVGDFLNTGTIIAASGSFDVDHTRFGGSFSNTGTIQSNQTGRAALAFTGGTTLGGNLFNSGTLRATGFSAGLVVSNSDIKGGLINLGTVSGHVAGVSITNSAIGHGIQNDGVIIAQDQSLAIVGSTLFGGINNTGTLFASDGSGVGLDIDHSTVVGDINNSGLISARSPAVRIDSSLIDGDFKNSGTLTGGSSGVSISGSTITGNFINSGRMETESNGVLLVSDTIAGDIRNSGTLKGEGPLILIDTHVGGSFINSGLMHSYSYGITLTDSQLNGGFTNSGSLNLAAGVQLRGSQLGNFVNTGTLQSSSSAYALLVLSSSVVGGLTNSGTIGGILVDSTSRLDNLLITGSDTARFTGAVEAPETHVSVAQGATFTLQDANLFHVADFTNNGTLGVAPGSATIAGNYTQASGATFVTHVLDDSNYGKLVVSGTASLADQAKIYVDVSDTSHAFTSASLNDVISAGTLQSNGTFNVTSNSQLFQFAGVKDDNSVDLAISAKAADGVSAAVAPANLGAARVLDAQFANALTSTLTPYFVSATSASQVNNAVAQTLPLSSTLHTSQATVANINDVVQSRIDANTGLASGDGFYGDSTLWMKPFGSWVDQNGRNGATGYNANIWGMVFGADGVLSENTRLGVSFAYAKANTDSDNQAARQSANIDLYQLTGYGSYSVAPDTELSFHAGVGQNHNDGRRDIDLGGNSGHATANFDSLSASAGVALAKVFTLDETTRFTPSVRADYTWIRDEGYHEKGSTAVAPLLLDVDARKTDQLILGLDGKLSHDLVPGTSVTANLGVGYDVLHENDSITSSYAGASDQSFTTRGLDPSPWLARGGVGLATKIANGAEISVNYDIETRSDFNEQTASIKLSVPF